MDLIYEHSVLGNFQYGGYPQSSILYDCQHLYFEWIWNNYVDIQQKNIPVRITMISCVRGYNSLSYPTLHLGYKRI